MPRAARRRAAGMHSWPPILFYSVQDHSRERCGSVVVSALPRERSSRAGALAASHPGVSWTASLTFVFEGGPDDRTLLRINLRLAIRISSRFGGMCLAWI